MRKRCEDCGCRLNGGICSNCHEEHYIMTYQADDMVTPVSNEFKNKAEEQAQQIKDRDRRGRP